jgi:hypothetical protein
MAGIGQLGNSYALNQGVIPMDDQMGVHPDTLPSQRKMSPPDLGFQPQVDLLLEQPSAETTLELWTRLDLDDPTLLEPGEFEDVLLQALQTVKLALLSAKPEDVNALKRMDRLGGEVQEMRGMCDTMRRALYAG